MSLSRRRKLKTSKHNYWYDALYPTEQSYVQQTGLVNVQHLSDVAIAASSSKSDIKWQVSEITKCPICLDDCKNPKSLPCLHSFCLHCLQQHWKDKCPGDEVPCPVCRKLLKIPYEGLRGLPHNFFVQNLIDARWASDERPGVVLYNCESCQKDSEEIEGGIPPATTYCVDCNQKLCRRCSRPHKAMTDPHQVLEADFNDVEQIQQRGSRCQQHAGKQLELYCFACKINICRDCFAVRHTKHKCLEVKTVAEDLAESFKRDAQQLSTRISEFHAAMMQTDAGEKRLMRDVQGVDTSVRQRGETLKHTVDSQVDNLRRQLETFKTASQKELASRKDGLELGITAMESFTAYSLELMSKGSPCDITRAASELHTRADELLKTHVTPADYCAPVVKFVPMNIDELTESRDVDKNLIGRVLTSINNDTVGKLRKQQLLHFASL